MKIENTKRLLKRDIAKFRVSSILVENGKERCRVKLLHNRMKKYLRDHPEDFDFINLKGNLVNPKKTYEFWVDVEFLPELTRKLSSLRDKIDASDIHEKNLRK